MEPHPIDLPLGKPVVSTIDSLWLKARLKTGGGIVPLETMAPALLQPIRAKSGAVFLECTRRDSLGSLHTIACGEASQFRDPQKNAVRHPRAEENHVIALPVSTRTARSASCSFKRLFYIDTRKGAGIEETLDAL